MDVFDEMKAYVGFVPDDGELLRAFWAETAHARADDVVRGFYSRVNQSEVTARLLSNDATAERLRVTLLIWMKELFNGPWDLAYYKRRQRIGQVHVNVGLPHRFMFMAMSVVRQQLHEIAVSSCEPPDAIAVCQAVDRITAIDLAIMTQHYSQVSASAQLATLQEIIVSHLPVTVLLCSPNGEVNAATRPSKSLFDANQDGVITLDEALPLALIEASDLINQVRRSSETGREITLFRVDVDGADRNRSFKIQLVPLPGDPPQVLVHIADLTETVETEARLRRSESLAQLGALSAAVAHEVRNPLAGISGAIQVIAGSLPENDPRRGIMVKIREQISRLNDLVSDLLAFARPKDPNMEDVDLRAICDSVVELVRAEHAEARLEVIGAGEAFADGDMVQRIVLNLIGNAVQAAGNEGHVIVRVAPGTIVVADDGPGVPKEVRSKVFEPFFTTRLKGTGLGLAICQNSASAMGGLVELVEGPLDGAAFRVQLDLPLGNA